MLRKVLLLLRKTPALRFVHRGVQLGLYRDVPMADAARRRRTGGEDEELIFAQQAVMKVSEPKLSFGSAA
jgi:hypothetical protein